jgi:hypothetical protein
LRNSGWTRALGAVLHPIRDEGEAMRIRTAVVGAVALLGLPLVSAPAHAVSLSDVFDCISTGEFSPALPLTGTTTSHVSATGTLVYVSDSDLLSSLLPEAGIGTCTISATYIGSVASGTMTGAFVVASPDEGDETFNFNAAVVAGVGPWNGTSQADDGTDTGNGAVQIVPTSLNGSALLNFSIAALDS